MFCGWNPEKRSGFRSKHIIIHAGNVQTPRCGRKNLTFYGYKIFWGFNSRREFKTGWGRHTVSKEKVAKVLMLCIKICKLCVVCKNSNSLPVSEVWRKETTNSSPEGVVQRENFPEGMVPRTASLIDGFSAKDQSGRAALIFWYSVLLSANKAIYTPTFFRTVIIILSNKEHFGNYREIVFKNHAVDDRIPHFSK